MTKKKSMVKEKNVKYCLAITDKLHSFHLLQQWYDKKKLYREGDSERFIAMMEAYENKTSSDNYHEAVAKKCCEFLNEIIKPKFAVRYAVALGARDFMWDVLFDKVEENALRRGNIK